MHAIASAFARGQPPSFACSTAASMRVSEPMAPFGLVSSSKLDAPWRNRHPAASTSSMHLPFRHVSLLPQHHNRRRHPSSGIAPRGRRPILGCCLTRHPTHAAHTASCRQGPPGRDIRGRDRAPAYTVSTARARHRGRRRRASRARGGRDLVPARAGPSSSSSSDLRCLSWALRSLLRPLPSGDARRKRHVLCALRRLRALARRAARAAAAW